MGYAIANCLAEQGAEVILISGQVANQNINNKIKLVNVVTANEMFVETTKYFSKCDAAILAAAVADYTPKVVSEKKIKHSANNTIIELIPTKDIAAHLGSIKKDNQKIIGFALETNDELKNAKLKLKSKNLDFIVLNSLNDKGSGFGTETNKVTFVFKNNKIINFELKHKSQVAEDIADELHKLLS